MKKFAILIPLLLCSKVFAQEPAAPSSNDFKKNALYVELLGDALLYSINYDRLFVVKEEFKFGGRIGFSYVAISLFDESKGPAIPLELLGMYGRKHHLEFGLGASYFSLKVTDNSILGPPVKYDLTRLFMTGRLGYRFQRPQGGFVFRAGFTPLLLVSESTTQPNPKKISAFLPYGGISFGYSF